MSKQPRTGKSATKRGSQRAGPQDSCRKFIGSLRSQKSLKRQYDLEDQIVKFEKLIAFEQGKLKDAEVNRLRQAKQVAGGQGLYMRALEDSIAELEQRKQKISAFRETVAGFRAEIEALQPSAAQKAERARKQAELTRLADERMEAVSSIDAAIHVLRQRLSIHAKLTEGMVKLAGEIDFSGGNFDSARFDALASALPVAMQGESGRWLIAFVGEEADRHPYKVRGESIVILAETLVAANIFRQGETGLVTEKQRAELDKEPPHALSTVEYEALHYAAKKPGEEIDTRNFPGNGILFP